MPFPGINTDDNRFPEAAARLFNQPGVFHGGGAQDDPLYAGFEQLLDGLRSADASAELSGNQQAVGDVSYYLQINELTPGGAIQVNDMYPGCPQRLPLQGDLYRLLGEYRFLVIVTLIEADTLTLFQVYCRDNFYFDYLITD